MTQNITSDFLRDLGLDELIAYSEEEYISKACNLANNPRKNRCLQ